MYSLIFVTVVGCLLSLLLAPIVRRLAHKWQLVDQPDGGRKTHSAAVPRLGGVAIAMSYVMAYLVWSVTPLRAVGTVLETGVPQIVRLLPAGICIFAVGVLDDIWGLKPWQKLTGQALAAIWAFASGVRVTTLAGIEINGALSFALTIAWLLMCTNAFNLVDGMDGLAGGIGLLATLTILISSLLQGNVALALATAPLAGCLVGFLRFNLPPASIFLGDCGSLLIGFLLGSYAVIWSQKCATVLGLTAPLMAFAVPLLEVVLSVVRRFLQGKPIFSADRGHIHHMLLNRGLSTGRAVVVLYAVAGLAAVFSIAQSLILNQMASLVVILFSGFVWFGVQSLGYTEFRVTGRLLRDGSLREMIASQILAADVGREIQQAQTWEDCLLAVRRLALFQGFCGVEFVSGGGVPGGANGMKEESWSVQVAFGAGASVRLLHPINRPAKAAAVATLVGLINGPLSRRYDLLQETNQLQYIADAVERDRGTGMAEILSAQKSAKA